jgi:hypothetical protein
MAGDVAAVLSGGNLLLNEAAGHQGGDQKIAVSQIAPGLVRVAGAAGSGTLINGSAFQDFAVTGNLTVNFGAGNDLVVFDQLAPPKFNEIVLNVGAPSAPAGTDDDNVILWGINSRGSVSIDTGADDDWVFISNAHIGDGAGVDNLYVNLGAGADSMTLKNSPLLGDLGGSVDVQTYGLENEVDDDVVWLENVVMKNDLAVRTGAGKDTIHLGKTTVYDDVEISAGDGDDTVEIVDNTTVVDSLMARLGEGNDSLKLDRFWATSATVWGEGGYDSLTKSGGNVTTFSRTGWEVFNGRPTWMDDVFAPTKYLAKR